MSRKKMKEEIDKVANKQESVIEPVSPENDEKSRLIAASFRGPLPPPAVLREYDQISPGLAEKIIGMAESEGIASS